MSGRRAAAAAALTLLAGVAAAQESRVWSKVCASCHGAAQNDDLLRQFRMPTHDVSPELTLQTLTGIMSATLEREARAAADAVPPGAAACAGCHGPAGEDAAIPSLIGRPAAEVAAAMRDFRSGARHATLMGRIAKGYDDAEIDAIADYVTRRRD